MTTDVKYSCNLCGIHRVTVEVPARENEDLGAWMRTLTLRLQEDHGRRSPDCHADKLDEVLVPMDGRTKVGGPAIQ